MICNHPGINFRKVGIITWWLPIVKDSDKQNNEIFCYLLLNQEQKAIWEFISKDCECTMHSTMTFDLTFQRKIYGLLQY